MLVRCKYCQTILFEPIEYKYRCWVCHAWLNNDEIVYIKKENPQEEIKLDNIPRAAKKPSSESRD